MALIALSEGWIIKKSKNSIIYQLYLITKKNERKKKRGIFLQNLLSNYKDATLSFYSFYNTESVGKKVEARVCLL